MTSDSRWLAKVLSVSVLLQLTRIGSTTALLVYISRDISPGDLGLFLVSQSLAVLGGRLYAWGLGRSIIPFGDTMRLPLSPLLTVSMGSVALNCLWALPVHLIVSTIALSGGTIGRSTGGHLAVLVVWSIGLALTQVWSEAFRSSGHDVIAASLQGVGGGAVAGGFVLFGALGLGPIGIQNDSVSLGLVSTASVWASLALVLLLSRTRPGVAGLALMRGLQRFSWPSGLSQAAMFVLAESPTIVAAIAFGPVGAAPVALAKRVAAQVAMLPHALGLSIGAASYRDLVGGSRFTSHRRHAAQSFAVVTLLTVGGVGLLSAWTGALSLILAAPGAEAQAFVIPMAAPAVLLAATGAASYIGQMTSLASSCSRFALVATVVSVVVQYLVASHGSRLALAYGYGIGASAIYLFDYAMVRHRLGFDRSPRYLFDASLVRAQPAH